MAYEIIGWKNKGETGAKPINRDNLRHMDNGILNLDTYKAEIMPLLTVSDTAPVECERGDLYYNTTTELIYVATQPDTWSEEGTTPSIFNLYVDLSSSKLYYYDGTNFNSYGSGGGGETLPIGIILPFSDDTIPEGYMLCDGRAISRTTYSRLFSVIGTTYGAGDGSTTFNLPNLKGKVPVGYDSTDSDFDTLGETGGEKEHTLTIDEMPSHSHDIIYIKSASTPLSSNGLSGYSENNNGIGTNTNAIQNAGGGQAHNNLQPYQVVNYIIKVSQTTATQAQVVDGYSASTTDSYSCNYVNQKTLKKLWENTNTTTSFSTQTITLSSEDYDYLVWIYRFNTASNNNIQKSQLVLKGAGVIMDIAWDYGVGGSYTVADYYRKVQYTNNTTYSSGDCNIKYNNTQDAQDNNFIIPVAVYGGKF